MLRWKSVLAEALNSGRLAKGERRKQRARPTVSRRMQVESLEDRRMLAVDVFYIAGGPVGIDQASIGTNFDDNVTLSLGNFDPDGGQGAVAQDGLLVTDPDGVNALSPGLLQVNATQVFVPMDFDSDPGIGIALQEVLSDQINVDLGSGNDTLTIDVSATDILRHQFFYDGGTGSDSLTLTGTPTGVITATTYTPGLQPDEGTILFEDGGTPMSIAFDGLEPLVDLVPAEALIVNGNGDDNEITYAAGSIPTQGLVSIDGFETIEFANKTNLALQGLGGDDTIVANNLQLPTGLTQLGVLGGDGNDTIRLESLPDASATSFIGVASAAGEGGDDVIDGSGINVATPLALIGGAGDDTLTGGAGMDTIVGGADDDTLIDSPGDDTYDGGDGNNTLLFRGTINDDVIDVTQTAPTTVTLSNDLNPATITTETLVLGTIQQLRIKALDGDDLIRVAHADAFSDNDLFAVPPSESIRFVVEGNAPNASDRLVVQDLGLGDLVIHRVGSDQRSGSVTLGGTPNTLAPIAYEGIEFVSVTPFNNVTGATGVDELGQLVVFKHDPHESNASIASATFLGSGSTLNVDPTIDPAGVPAFGVPGDNDFYRFVAEKTGTLDLQVYFEEIPTLANGRPGLPNNGDLDIELYDATGALVAGAGPAFGGNNGGGVNPELNIDGDAAFEDERIRVPVVAGETYYLRVFGNVNGEGIGAINVYNITAINEAPPVPFDLELNDIIQIGTVNNGVVPTATVFRANIAPANGVLPPTDFDLIDKTIEFTSGANVGRSAIITAFNNATGQFTVGAGLLMAPAVGDSFIIESADTGRSQLDDTTRDNTPIVTFRLNDNLLLNDVPGNPASQSPPDEVIPIPFNSSQAAAFVAGAGFRVPVFIEGAPQQPGLPPLTPIGYAVPLAGVPGVYRFDFGTDAIGGALALTDGSHFISAGVEIIDPATAGQFGYGPRSQSLEIVVDTRVPEIFFGDPTIAADGLHADSDTGVVTTAATFSDRVTSDTTPTFWGRAEANSIIKAYVDLDDSGTLTAADAFIGETVAIPLDGTNQEPFGYWELTSAVNMNDAGLFANFDGPRTILVTAEDLAGNATPRATALTFFLDSQGPQITGLSVNAEAPAPSGGYDLFDPKPSINGPSPLVSSLTVHFRDLPFRSDVMGTANDFLSPALDPVVAATAGNYSVVGDANGTIAIVNAVVEPMFFASSSVTVAAAAGSNTLTDNENTAQPGDILLVNNGANAGQIRIVTNVVGAVVTLDAPLTNAQAVGDGYSIFASSNSLLHTSALRTNTAAQSTVTSTINTTTTFTVGNLANVAVVGDYVRFNTGANAGQLQRVTSVDATGTMITVGSPFTNVPTAGDTISLIDSSGTLGVAPLNSASVTLTFATPLPDDRFTVTVSDNLVDPAGNQLDGESNAIGPVEPPLFPTGDGVPGGSFAGRFTIDTRPEIGVWSAGTALIDINGNLLYDPENVDATNRDINFQIGFPSDNIFAGKFGISPVTGFATGFDTLAAYGRVGNQWRWMVDTNHDGTIVPGTDVIINEPLNVNGLPVAGNFDNNALNGDEVGVFDGNQWYLDTDHDFQLDTIVAANYSGFPIVGDFNGDGIDDLGAYRAVTNQLGGNLVSLDIGRTGAFTHQFRVGTGVGGVGGFNTYVGVRERAVAADMDADGVDDIGFWIPDGSALNPGDQGEWNFLVSGGASLLNRIANNFIAYTPTPFGNDFSARFGNSFAWPVVGNFDPPVTAGGELTESSTPTETVAVDTSQVQPIEETPEVVQEVAAEETAEIAVPEIAPEIEWANSESQPVETPITETTQAETSKDEEPQIVEPAAVEEAAEESAPMAQQVETASIAVQRQTAPVITYKGRSAQRVPRHLRYMGTTFTVPAAPVEQPTNNVISVVTTPSVETEPIEVVAEVQPVETTAVAIKAVEQTVPSLSYKGRSRPVAATSPVTVVTQPTTSAVPIADATVSSTQSAMIQTVTSAEQTDVAVLPVAASPAVGRMSYKAMLRSAVLPRHLTGFNSSYSGSVGSVDAALSETTSYRPTDDAVVENQHASESDSTAYDAAFDSLETEQV